MRLPVRALVLTLLCVGCAALGGVRDPVVNDPPARDGEHPAGMQGVGIESHGARINAVVYGAAGPGPHATLILLHGLPGNERNLDLAQAVRRAGWNVVFIHYRGAWGSEGSFSFSNALEDVVATLDYVTSPGFARDWRAHPERIALLGHSMGGFMALTTGSEDARARCIGSLAGANLGLFAQLEGEARAATAGALDEMTASLRGTSGAALMAETAANAARFDLVRRAPALAQRTLYLVAGRFDRVAPPELHHDPLVAALRVLGPASLRVQRLDADHAFSARRLALARGVVAWLQQDCAALW